MDGLVLLSLLLLRVEDSLVESVRVHFELNHRFVPLALGIFRTLQSDGDLEENLTQFIVLGITITWPFWRASSDLRGTVRLREVCTPAPRYWWVKGQRVPTRVLCW